VFPVTYELDLYILFDELVYVCVCLRACRVGGESQGF
jgi:hypothetical protein